MNTLRTLHDATLRRIEVDWASGELRLDFKIDKENKTVARIAAKGLTYLECPRQYPWGRSVSVNEITEQSRELGKLLTVAMQSGDLIKAHVAEFILEVA